VKPINPKRMIKTEDIKFSPELLFELLFDFYY
jgi:hypothetical protein